MSRWLLQFTVRDDEVKQNRRLPEIAFYDTDGNPITLSAGGPIATWAPDTDYSVGKVVINSGSLYQAVDDHTSGAVFGDDSAHWTALDSETDALALAQLATHAGLTTTAHGGIVASSDSRLTDARAPTAHKTTHAVGGSDALSPADIAAATAADLTAEQTARAAHAALTTTAHGGIVASGDSRLTDARTPTAHKTTHAVGGSDALSPADIGAVAASLVDAKGDLIAGSADNTVVRKAVGSDGQVLTADAASGGGIKWSDGATPNPHKSSHGSAGGDPLTPADIGAVALSLIDVKGDLIIGSADNAVARLAAGANGKVLRADSAQTNGLKWDDAVVTRVTTNFSTASIAANASENDDVTLPRQVKLYSITTNRPARVRAYSTSTHRTADASRAAGTDPIGNHGCLLDIVTTSSMLTIDLSPLVDLCNLDTTVADTIYFAVQNLDTVTGVVTTTFTYCRGE